MNHIATKSIFHAILIMYIFTVFLTYICIGSEMSCQNLPFLKTWHFNSYSQPQYKLALLGVTLLGFIFMRSYWLLSYSIFFAIALVSTFSLSVPLPW